MKQRNVKIEHDNTYIYEDSLAGAAKNKKGQYICELMEKADTMLPIGTQCTLYFQQQGAKGWGRWSYCVGSSNAYIE